MLDAVMREIQEIITNKHHEDNKDNPEHEHEHEYDYDYENR